MRNLFILAPLAALLLASCSSLGSNTTPTSGVGAGTNTGSQGSAQATESGSAVNTVRPVVVNAFGAQSVRVSADGTIEIEGSPDSALDLTGGVTTSVTVDGQEARVSSGGGSAGGADATRLGETPQPPEGQ